MREQAMLVSVEEHLNTSSPDGDRQYVDGRVVERNPATLQTVSFPEQRVQVRETRFRVPDVCVYLGRPPREQIFIAPPFLVIDSSHEVRGGSLRTEDPAIEARLSDLFPE
jgi:hypothetical protein